MNKPIYKEYQNLRGDNGDPNNTRLIANTDETSQNKIDDSLKDQYSKYEEPQLFSPSNSNMPMSTPKLIVQNVSDKLIDTTTADKENNKYHRGMLSYQSIEYQRKRLQTKNQIYDNKLKVRKGHHWRVQALKRWRVLLNIIIFVLNLEKSVNLKKKETTKINNEQMMTSAKIQGCLVSLFKFIIGLLIAILISLILLPFIYVSDLFLRLYTYNNIYVNYCLSYDNKIYRVFLLIQVYMYAFATLIAIITNLYQTIITTVELIYNIIGTFQNDFTGLTELLFQTIQNPFSKEK